VPIQHDDAATGIIEAGDDADEGRFAAAGSADDADEFPAVNIERDVAEYAVGSFSGPKDFSRPWTLRMTGAS